MSLARVARFYAVNPLTVPAWFLEILEMSISALRAEEQLAMSVATRIAGTTEDDWRRLTRQLKNVARPCEPIPIATVSPKLAEWFERNGIPYVVAEGV